MSRCVCGRGTPASSSIRLPPSPSPWRRWSRPHDRSYAMTQDVADPPVQIGRMLFTMVDPNRGHEVAYNRWYERDHFYAGCLVGPYNFAGRRYVATAELKALRDPDPSAITGEPARGSYVSVYWVLDG